jgi:hypothetical protein
MLAQWALAHQVWLAAMAVVVPALLLELQVVAALPALPVLAQTVAVVLQLAPAELLESVVLLALLPVQQMVV